MEPTYFPKCKIESKEQSASLFFLIFFVCLFVCFLFLFVFFLFLCLSVCFFFVCLSSLLFSLKLTYLLKVTGPLNSQINVSTSGGFTSKLYSVKIYIEVSFLGLFLQLEWLYCIIISSCMC